MVCGDCVHKLAKRLVEHHSFQLDWILAQELALKGFERLAEQPQPTTVYPHDPTAPKCLSSPPYYECGTPCDGTQQYDWEGTQKLYSHIVCTCGHNPQCTSVTKYWKCDPGYQWNGSQCVLIPVVSLTESSFESLKAGGNWTRTLTDKIGDKDTFLAALNKQRSLAADKLGGIDTVLAVHNISHPFLNKLGGIDSLTHTLQKIKTLREYGYESLKKSVGRTFLQKMGNFDSKSRARTLIRNFTQLLGLKETKTAVHVLTLTEYGYETLEYLPIVPLSETGTEEISSIDVDLGITITLLQQGFETIQKTENYDQAFKVLPKLSAENEKIFKTSPRFSSKFDQLFTVFCHYKQEYNDQTFSVNPNYTFNDPYFNSGNVQDILINILILLKNSWSLTEELYPGLSSTNLAFSTGWYNESIAMPQITITPLASTKGVLSCGSDPLYGYTNYVNIDIWVRPLQDSGRSIGQAKWAEYNIRREVERILRSGSRIGSQYNNEEFIYFGKRSHRDEIDKRPVIFRTTIQVIDNLFRETYGDE